MIVQQSFILLSLNSTSCPSWGKGRYLPPVFFFAERGNKNDFQRTAGSTGNKQQILDSYHEGGCQFLPAHQQHHRKRAAELRRLHTPGAEPMKHGEQNPNCPRETQRTGTATRTATKEGPHQRSVPSSAGVKVKQGTAKTEQAMSPLWKRSTRTGPS